MIKGLLGGLLSGGVVSAAVLGAVSLMSAPPAPRGLATASRQEPAIPALPTPEAQPTVSSGSDTEPATADATSETQVPSQAEPAPTISAGDQPAPTAQPGETAPEAAVINPPAGSEFDKPAVDAPAAAPAPDAKVEILPAPEATTPEATEPAPPAAGAETAPQPSRSDATVLATAPDADSAPMAPAGMDQPAEAAPAPMPDASPPQDAAPMPPVMSEADQPAIPEQSGQMSDATTPGAVTPDAMPDETAPDEIAPDEPLPDEPLPDEAMPGDTPAEAGAGTGSASVGKRVLPPVLKLGEKLPEGAASSDLPPVISPEAPEAPKGVTAAPKPGFVRPVPGVRVNRLPTIQSAPQAGEQAALDMPVDNPLLRPEAPSAPEAPAIAPRAETPDMPLHRYAARLDNPANLPVLGVVVIDIGELRGGADLAQLLALPSPVTVAINPMRKDTQDVAVRSRARGFEVAMLVDGLPKDGTASDVEVAYQSISAAMPEAVAVMTSPESTLLSRRTVAQQMVAILKDEGIGLVSYARGLSPARELARGQGLPQAEVSRVVDEPRGDVAAILRNLESEAFQAQQKGGAVVVLRSYPDSLAALAQFMAKAEAEKSGVGVKVGPVTAFLK